MAPLKGVGNLPHNKGGSISLEDNPKEDTSLHASVTGKTQSSPDINPDQRTHKSPVKGIMGQPSSSHPTTNDGFSVTNVLEEPPDLPPPTTQPSHMPPTTGDRVVYLSGDAPKYGKVMRTLVSDGAPMAEVKFYSPMTQDGKHGHVLLVSSERLTRVENYVPASGQDVEEVASLEQLFEQTSPPASEQLESSQA